MRSRSRLIVIPLIILAFGVVSPLYAGAQNPVSQSRSVEGEVLRTDTDYDLLCYAFFGPSECPILSETLSSDEDFDVAPDFLPWSGSASAGGLPLDGFGSAIQDSSMEQAYGLVLLVFITLACGFPLIIVDRFARLRSRKRATRSLRRLVTTVTRDDDVNPYSDLLIALADSILIVEVDPPSRWNRYLTGKNWTNTFDELPKFVDDEEGIWFLAIPAFEDDERPTEIEKYAYVSGRRALRSATPERRQHPIASRTWQTNASPRGSTPDHQDHLQPPTRGSRPQRALLNASVTPQHASVDTPMSSNDNGSRVESRIGHEVFPPITTAVRCS